MDNTMTYEQELEHLISIEPRKCKLQHLYDKIDASNEMKRWCRKWLCELVTYEDEDGCEQVGKVRGYREDGEVVNALLDERGSVIKEEVDKLNEEDLNLLVKRVLKNEGMTLDQVKATILSSEEHNETYKAILKNQPTYEENYEWYVKMKDLGDRAKDNEEVQAYVDYYQINAWLNVNSKI